MPPQSPPTLNSDLSVVWNILMIHHNSLHLLSHLLQGDGKFPRPSGQVEVSVKDRGR